MTSAFIAGDWGTSHLRLFLCGADDEILDQRTGPGIATTRGASADVFLSLAQAWYDQQPDLPAILCGMVGSTIGWHEVPYLPCPAPITGLARAATRFEVSGHEIVLVPGMSCRNPLAAPDMMRGEETQIFGALRQQPALTQGRHLLCLPGTHAKWALVENGGVTRFLTAVTGELFELLVRHSILVKGGVTASPKQAVALPASDASPLHRLFEARSRQLAGEFSPEQASAYLSALIIGEDVSGALRLFPGFAAVTVIGGGDLPARYAEALQARSVEARTIDGGEAVLAGLCALHQEMFA